MDILDSNEYGPNNKSVYRYILRKIDNFKKLKNKNTQSVSNSFENILDPSNRKPNSTELHGGSEFVKLLFTNLLRTKTIKDSVYYVPRSYFAESFNRTLTGLLKKPVFQKGDANSVDILSTILF